MEKKEIKENERENEENKWEEIPYVPLIRIFSFLDVNDICRVGLVCQSFFEASKSNQIWRPICEKDFLIYQLDEDDENSFKLKYKKIVEKWGKTIFYFKRCKIISIKMNKFIEEKKMKTKLNPPVSQDDVNDIETLLQSPFAFFFSSFFIKFRKLFNDYLKFLFIYYLFHYYYSYYYANILLFNYLFYLFSSVMIIMLLIN